MALLLGTWAVGALLFSSGVVVLGIGSLGDWSVGIVLIIAGLGAVVGILAHLVTGVLP